MTDKQEDAAVSPAGASEPPQFQLAGETRGAEISGPYRYRLWREWGTGARLLLWVMLNPSTADAEVDDQTIRKCAAFTKREAFDGFHVCNLFAWRETNPKLLPKSDRAIGIGNDETIRAEVDRCALVVVAWGKISKSQQPRAANVLELLAAHRHPVHCLGVNQDGSPRHPLYLANSTAFQVYS